MTKTHALYGAWFRVEVEKIVFYDCLDVYHKSPVFGEREYKSKTWKGRFDPTLRTGDRQATGDRQKLARAADTEHSNQHICAARPSRRARCGAGAGCSAIKYQSL